MAGAAGVALEVFALVVGSIIGLVDIFLPPPIIPEDFFAHGDSILRIGIGLNSSSREDLGGTIPSIKVFNEESVLIGQADAVRSGDEHTSVGEGAFATIPVIHNTTYKFQQPTYVEIAGGSDAICVAYLAQTWPDGTQLGWLGDMGKFCEAKWYHSNLFVTLNNGTYKPYCTWIGGQRTQSCPNCTSTPNDPMFTYAGFKLHIPDFGPVGQQHDFSVPANPQSLCDSSKLQWYKNSRFTSPAPTIRPLASIKTCISALLAILSKFREVSAAAVEQFSVWTRDEEAQVLFRSSIVGSHDPQHSSRELCASSSSWGADFVSFEEGLFCDMALKKTWPLCSGDVARGCYDWHTHTTVDGKRRKRAIKYQKVLEWK